MNIAMSQQKLYVLVGLILAICVAAALFVWRGNSLGQPSPQQQVARIMEGKPDVTQSLYPPEDLQKILETISSRKSKFLSGEDASAQNLIDLARAVRDVRDFDTALKLFEVADTLHTKDLFYRIDWGNIYLEEQQWEEARLIFEPMRTTWPVHETYLGLAAAYEHIEGTPDYVIEDIYTEGEFRTHKFEVYEAHANWLTSKGREAETIALYEQMEQLAPQAIIENKIKELKAKYNK